MKRLNNPIAQTARALISAARIFTEPISILVCLISFGSTVLSKDWRGITPPQSTVADVERRIGPPTERNDIALYYNLSDEIAVVSFQGDRCDQFGLGWDVPIGTVTDVGIIPKRTLTTNRFVFGHDFKIENAGAGLSYFTNEKDGFSIESFKGKITLLTYTPGSAESGRKCLRIQTCCIDPIPKFDEYGRIPFEEEKTRLDNFVRQMREQMFRGAIVVYGKNGLTRNQLLKRAQRAKRYLEETRGLESQRLLILDGGFKERSNMQLNIYPITGEFSHIYTP